MWCTILLMLRADQPVGGDVPVVGAMGTVSTVHYKGGSLGMKVSRAS